MARVTFGTVAGEDTIDGIAKVLSDYSRINGIRKPEVITSSTYNLTNYKEANIIRTRAITLENEARKYFELIPEDYKDTYYQLVFYPAVASANIIKMQINAGFNQFYYKLGSVLANQFGKLVEEAIIIDEQLQCYYNDTMSSGKWQGIMSSPHIGYTNWDSKGWQYPQINFVVPRSDSFMIVNMEGLEVGYTSGTAILPPFTSLGRDSCSVTISNGGCIGFDFKTVANSDWIKIDTDHGTIGDDLTILISIDWNYVTAKSGGIITITGNGQKVDISLTAEAVDISNLSEMCFVAVDNIISIEAEHTFNQVGKSGVEWKVIVNYGRTLSSIKMFPTTISFEQIEDAQYLEYSIYLENAGEYIVTVLSAPTNNLLFNSRLKYGISFDGVNPVIADSLQPGYVAGNYNNKFWKEGVLDNIHIMTTAHKLEKGAHILRFYGLDAGLVLQKLVISKGTPPASYLAPPESYYKIRNTSYNNY